MKLFYNWLNFLIARHLYTYLNSTVADPGWRKSPPSWKKLHIFSLIFGCESIIKITNLEDFRSPSPLRWGILEKYKWVSKKNFVSFKNFGSSFPPKMMIWIRQCDIEEWLDSQNNIVWFFTFPLDGKIMIVQFCSYVRMLVEWKDRLFF